MMQYISGKFYKKNDVVFKSGAYYVAKKSTTADPEKSKDWELKTKQEAKTLAAIAPNTPSDYIRIERGEKGDKGERGERGVSGKNGIDGKNGRDGLNGRDGKDGNDGKDGKDGINGLNGINGKDGINGKNGKDGLSLYYKWDGTKLGIRREDESEFQFVDLKGDAAAAQVAIGGGGRTRFKDIVGWFDPNNISVDYTNKLISIVGSGGAVDSVNGQTGVVVLDADDIDDTSTTHKFTTASDISKLAGIEAGADVTDTANVTAAGALMDSELTSLSGVKTLTVPDNVTISAFGASLADDADASAARTTLGLGTLATQSGTFSGTSSGTNTGDQTSIVGITGTKAQFDTACTDGNFLYVGDITQYTDEMAQDAAASLIQNGTGITWSYNDGANTLTPTVSLSAFSTSNLSEGSNLYYTDERVDDRVAALLVAGSNITLTYNDVAGTLTIDASGGGGGAPTGAEYVVLSTNGSLTHERVLTAGTGISITDGGAGSTVTIASSITQYTDEMAQDAVGAMVDSSLNYVDGTPLLQRAALTGDVTASAGSNSTTIASSAVTLAKMADVATSTVFYRKTAGTGAPEVQTLATLKTDLGLTGTNSGDVTVTDSSEIDFTLTGQNITASLIAGSIDESKLDASVNASLDLADSAAQNSFTTIAVSGQSDVVADSATDTLTLVAGSNITITTDAGTDTITIAASGGSGVADGNYGDIIVSSSGTVWSLDNTVNTDTGFRGSASQVPVLYLDAKGRVLAATDTSIQIATSQITNFATDVATEANTEIAASLINSTTIEWTTVVDQYQPSVIASSIGTTQLANDGVTYAKIQNVSAASKLLGRGSASGSGDVEEITLGSGLSMSGTTLSGSTSNITPLRVVTASGAVTVNATTDYVVVVNKTTGEATTVNLPASPATGLTFEIKDGKGDAATNPITLTPASGNIDGNTTYVMATNYENAKVIYNGTQWNVL